MKDLLQNLWSGLKLAAFLPTKENDFRSGLMLASVGLLISILTIGAASYFEQEYEIYVSIYGVLSLVSITFAVFLAALAFAVGQNSLEKFPIILTVWASATPTVVFVAIVLFKTLNNSSARILLLITLLIWLVIVARKGARLAFPEASAKSLSILGIGVVGFSSSMLVIGLVPVLFFSYDNEPYDEYVAIDQEDIYFNQEELLEGELDRVGAGNPGITDLYFIGFAGNGDESVFQSEANFAASVVDDKYGTSERAIVLSNNLKNLATKPLANSYNLYETIRRFSEKMDVEDDVLFMFLTSHGSRNATIDVSLFPFELKPVSAEGLKNALDESGVLWRIIVVSACYSGSFIDTLKDERTAIFAAAASDRTSFGCSSERELTYFGEAFFRDSLAQSDSLEETFDRSLKLIRERELSEDRTPSNPQSYFGDLIRPKLAELGVRAGD